MLPHQYYSDPWYAEQALALETGAPRPRVPVEVTIPLRWVMLTCAAIWTVAVAAAGVVKWMA